MGGDFDAIVIGAGHNGLVAATILARHGLDVAVLEAAPVVGGAVRTEYPFARTPGVGASTGAYLLGPMPPELLATLGIELPLMRRDPHYFLPTLDRRYLLVGSDADALRRQYLEFFSEQDWEAARALEREIADLRDDLAPSWLEEPVSAEETAERHIRPQLRRAFLELVREPVESYLARFGFRSELVLAMYAATDGFPGLSAGFGSPGTGLNFLVHNMCRLPGADGTWMIVGGGMGTVARELARVAREAGAAIHVGTPVVSVLSSGGTVDGVATADGKTIRATVVVSGADPFRLRELAGRHAFPEDFNRKLDDLYRPGTTMKVNLALDRLPTFRCLPEDRGQFRSTIHILPQEPGVIDRLSRAFEQARRGELPDFPIIEWYTHTRVDPSLRDANGRENAALFVQWVPYEPAGGSWDELAPRYAHHLFDVVDQFAPGFSAAIADMDILTPKTIESRFGMTGGHIQHVDNTIGFDARMPYVTPVAGLYACSAGCHPGGSVVGAAGYVAARRVLRDLGIAGATSSGGG